MEDYTMKSFAQKFGCKVFDQRVMKERLPKETYKSLKASMDHGRSLDPEIASIVASAMKDWAVENGATHFTHWFQPMTGITAGKHDSFLSPQGDGSIILEFSGKELIKGEPDASSFPNGGLRNTFEARGYTIWDCSSPAFIKEGTLYIPTAFCSYTGEALDTKTPLLRSMEVVNTQALRVLKLFGNHTSTRVIPTVGAEQEYFLVDRKNYEDRLDLKICGRTLFGAKPPKGQEMDDHYCGRIRLRIADYMRQLDDQLWQYGINSKTKHNEVAPAQHEMAPVFDSANVATDHNQLTMELMRSVAKQNGLACLLHEKPFEHINGSGKHNNWSLSTDDGINLLDPGKTPYENMQFLIFLCAVIRSIDKYPELLRLTAASPGNDHRLGANEAPPAIISIFLGEHLTATLQHIADGVAEEKSSNGVLNTKVTILPNLPKDDSDRNRTSPFAFTGNKFEFRMVGSSASIASSNWVLNTIMAESLETFADILESTDDFDRDVRLIVHETMYHHGKVIFNGNGYSEKWVEEAERRGLPNISNSVDAAKAFIMDKSIELFQRYGIFTPKECESRYEIMLENYIKTISIEANTMLEMTKRQILPAAIKYVGDISASYNEVTSSGVENKAMLKLVNQLSSMIDCVHDIMEILEQEVNAAHTNDLWQTAVNYRDKVIPQMESLRNCVDAMETITSSEYWPMPTYTDLLYRV